MSFLTQFAGKFAPFVWPAYGVTALGFSWMIADTLWRARRWRGEVNRLERAAADLPSGRSSR